MSCFGEHCAGRCTYRLHCFSAHARFASLQLDWGHHDRRLLGPTTCLPHKDGGIPFSVLPEDTTRRLAGLFSTLYLFVERQAKEL